MEIYYNWCIWLKYIREGETIMFYMGIDIDSLCDLASQGSGITISSMCTVFAESEVISVYLLSNYRYFPTKIKFLNRIADQSESIDIKETPSKPYCTRDSLNVSLLQSGFLYFLDVPLG